ncbi:MAG: hypothetical protein JNM00_00765, partial [Flavobacteriales bacterium]|nr:hypothetical protein [Flavobacteriales bacterium]
MKSLFIFIAVIAINIPVWSQAYEYQRADKSPKDAFPLQATWMNVQAPVTMEQLQLKAVMLVFTTDNCPAGLNNAMLAQEYCRSHSAIQTIIVWLKGKAHDRTAMTEELRAYGIYEPVVVVDNLDAFKSSSVTKLPMICVQEEAGKTAYQATSYYELPAVRLSHLDDLIDGTAGNRTFSLSRLSSDDLLFTRAEPLIAFPSHIDAMSDGSGLWVTDRPHHRIALLEPDGEVNTVIGSTSKGNQDGRFSEAKFNYPGGVSFMPATNTLYIADTYNHRICAADLGTQKVSTLLGGKQPVSKTDKGKTITGIGLPVDVLAGNKSLYFVSAWDMGVYAWDLVAE